MPIRSPNKKLQSLDRFWADVKEVDGEEVMCDKDHYTLEDAVRCGQKGKLVKMVEWVRDRSPQFAYVDFKLANPPSYVPPKCTRHPWYAGINTPKYCEQCKLIKRWRRGLL